MNAHTHTHTTTPQKAADGKECDVCTFVCMHDVGLFAGIHQRRRSHSSNRYDCKLPCFSEEEKEEEKEEEEDIVRSHVCIFSRSKHARKQITTTAAAAVAAAADALFFISSFFFPWMHLFKIGISPGLFSLLL